MSPVPNVLLALIMAQIDGPVLIENQAIAMTLSMIRYHTLRKIKRASKILSGLKPAVILAAGCFFCREQFYAKVFPGIYDKYNGSIHDGSEGNCMSGINRISGLASGMDIDQIVGDLMKAQRMRLDKVVQNKQVWQWRQDDYRAINTSLLALRNEVFNLKLQSTFLSRNVTSSDEKIVTATAGNNAATTSYQVEVKQLAKVATNVSTDAIANDDFDESKPLLDQAENLVIKQGTDFGWEAGIHKFSFSINGKEFNFDASIHSLNDVIREVNASGAGVTMFYDPGTKKVSIATTRTGENAKINLEDINDGAFLTNVLQLDMTEKQGTDAVFSINGLVGMTSHDNTYTVNGVTFNFNAAEEGKMVTVTVEQDIDSIVASIKGFVDKYNETLEVINDKLYEARYPDYNPLTDEQIEEGKLTDRQIDAWQDKARSGLLKGDTLLENTASGMRSVLSGVMAGASGEVTVTRGTQEFTTAADRLSVIGITTGPWSERGKLHLDENRLREALQSNPEAVMELFTSSKDADGKEITDSKQKGLAVQLYDVIKHSMSRITKQAGSGDSLYDDSFIGRTVKDIDKNIEVMESRFQQLEDRYYKQFIAMEQAINRMNAQSMWLAQQFFSGQ